jgi:hypothetical protein
VIKGLLSVCAALCLAAAAGATQAAPSQTPQTPSVAGHWTGAIDLPNGPLAVEIDLKPDTPPAWIGAISIAAQNLKGYPLGRVEVAGTSVTLTIANVPGDPTFTGTLSADGQTITGNFTQGPGSMPFKLTRAGDAVFAPPTKSTAIAKDVEGRWSGTLQTPGPALRLTMTLANGPDGATGTMVSVDQGGVEIKIASIVQAGARVTLELPTVAGTFDGELKDGRLVGTWTQGPAKMPLEFTRVP